jgi:hypothetical protein
MRYVRNEMSTYTGKRRLASFNQRFPNLLLRRPSSLSEFSSVRMVRVVRGYLKLRIAVPNT